LECTYPGTVPFPGRPWLYCVLLFFWILLLWLFLYYSVPLLEFYLTTTPPDLYVEPLSRHRIHFLPGKSPTYSPVFYCRVTPCLVFFMLYHPLVHPAPRGTGEVLIGADHSNLFNSHLRPPDPTATQFFYLFLFFSCAPAVYPPFLFGRDKRLVAAAFPFPAFFFVLLCEFFFSKFCPMSGSSFFVFA